MPAIPPAFAARSRGFEEKGENFEEHATNFKEYWPTFEAKTANFKEKRLDFEVNAADFKENVANFEANATTFKEKRATFEVTRSKKPVLPKVSRNDAVNDAVDVLEFGKQRTGFNAKAQSRQDATGFFYHETRKP